MAGKKSQREKEPPLERKDGHTPYMESQIPFEIGSLDLACKGGAHTGLMNLITGPPRAGKTLAAYRLIRSFLRRDTRGVTYFAGENKVDTDFMEQLGIDLARVQIEPPDYQDVIYDLIMETAEQAGDVGLILVDSVRSMVVRKRFKEDAFSQPFMQFSPEATAHNQLIGMLNIVQAKRARADSPLTLIFINHEGLAPPTFPGGPPQRIIPRGKNQLYLSSLRIRFSPPEYLKEHEHKGMKMATQVRFRFQLDGNKAGATGISSHFLMNQAVNTVAIDGQVVSMPVGSLDDMDFWYTWGKEIGYIGGGGKSWMVGERGPFPNQETIFLGWLHDRKQYEEDQDAIRPLAIAAYYA